VDPSEKISREFIIACRDSAKVLELVEEALDEITLRIEGKIAGRCRGAARVGRNHGLAISKRIIEMHGGKIWVLGKGATFSFTTPVKMEQQVKAV
jgi:signal transduction histidine kinase